MAVTDSFLTFVLDQLSGLGDVSSRRMFGGVGLYCGDLFFGILANDQLYLKVDDGNRARHERARMRPFQPDPRRPETMQYYGVPLAVLEDPEELVQWAERAVGAATRARAKRPAKPPTSKRRTPTRTAR